MPTTTPVDLSDSALWQERFSRRAVRRVPPRAADLPPRAHRRGRQDGQARLLDDHQAPARPAHPPRHRLVHRRRRSAHPGHRRHRRSFPTIINMDPPDLTKRRRVMSHAFTPKAIGKLEDGIRAQGGIADRPTARRRRRRLDRRRRRRAPDVGHRRHHRHPRRGPAGDLRHPRPHPEGECARFGHRPSEQSLELFGKIFTYALELTAEKRRNPVDDIWSTLTSAVVTDENGEQLSIPANELEIFFFVLDLRGQRHHQERAGLGTAGVRRQSRRDRAVSRRRGDPVRARSKRCCAGRRRSRSGRAARRSTWRWTVSPSRRATGWCRCCGRPTATKRSSTTRSRSTSAAPRTRTSRSAAAGRTIAWARCWPAPRSARCSTNCCCRADDISLGPPKVTYPNLTNNMSIFDEMAISADAR